MMFDKGSNKLYKAPESFFVETIIVVLTAPDGLVSLSPITKNRVELLWLSSKLRDNILGHIFQQRFRLLSAAALLFRCN